MCGTSASYVFMLGASKVLPVTSFCPCQTKFAKLEGEPKAEGSVGAMHVAVLGGVGKVLPTVKFMMDYGCER